MAETDDMDDAVEETEGETSETMFDRIKTITGLEPEEGESSDDYKGRVIRYLNDLEDDEYDRVMERNDDLAEWASAATTVYRENRGGRKKRPLPALEGLDEAEAVAEAKPKGRRGRKPKSETDPNAPPKEKVVRTPRTVESNRFFRVSELLIAHPGLTADQLVELAEKQKLDYSDRSVRRVHEAWTGITAALRKHGHLPAA